MFYSEYGKTGAKVSAVGFGGMRFDTSKSNEENAPLLLYAQSKGINITKDEFEQKFYHLI